MCVLVRGYYSPIDCVTYAKPDIVKSREFDPVHYYCYNYYASFASTNSISSLNFSTERQTTSLVICNNNMLKACRQVPNP